MLGFLVAAVLCAGACYDPAVGGASADGDAAGMGGDAARTDAPSSPEFVAFADANPVRLDSLSLDLAEDEDPTLTADQLDLWFTSDRGSSKDIYTSSRMSTAEGWPAPTLVVELETGEDEVTPEVSGDGLTLFFSRGSATNGLEVYQATRTSRIELWSPIVAVDPLNSPSDDQAPVLVGTGLRAYFCTDRAGTQDLATIMRPGENQPWGLATILMLLQTEKRECSPWVNDGGDRMAFDSDRDGSDNDVYFTRRPLDTEAWDTPSVLYHSAADDEDPWLTQDLRVMYFSSSQAGSRDLWMVTAE